MQPRMKSPKTIIPEVMWSPVLLWVATTSVSRLNVSARRIAVAGLHGKAMQQGSVAVAEHLRISIWWQFTTLDCLLQSRDQRGGASTTIVGKQGYPVPPRCRGPSQLSAAGLLTG